MCSRLVKRNLRCSRLVAAENSSLRRANGKLVIGSGALECVKQ